MERIALDIVGPLPKTSCRNRYILVITGYITRWAEAVSLPNQEASTVAQALMKEWICRYGAPDSIHTDQWRNFESCLFSELCSLLDIHKTRTTPYHPQLDGLVERLNPTLRQLLTNQMQKCPEDTWDDHLAPLMLAYRSSVNDSINFTPHYLMFGREIGLPVDIMLGGEKAPGELPTVKNVRSCLKEHMTLLESMEKEHKSGRKITMIARPRKEDTSQVTWCGSTVQRRLQEKQRNFIVPGRSVQGHQSYFRCGLSDSTCYSFIR